MSTALPCTGSSTPESVVTPQWPRSPVARVYRCSQCCSEHAPGCVKSSESAMTDGIERDLRRLDTDRPLSPALYERLEAALLDEADDGALFDALDSPRPIPATT